MTAPVLRLHSNAYAAGTRHARHEHDELQISLILRGEVREQVGGESQWGGALSVVVKDPGVQHADDFGTRGAFMARLSVPRTEFARLVEPERATHWRWTHVARVARPFLRLVGRGNAGEREFTHDDSDVLDLVAAITARAAATNGNPPAWLAEAARQMTEGWSPRLSIADVARGAGVHPVYLARCIRRWYGCAAGDLLREARLSHAAESLLAADRTASAVAHETGFADEAHLCRALRDAVGSTPGCFRRTTRAFAG